MSATKRVGAFVLAVMMVISTIPAYAFGGGLYPGESPVGFLPLEDREYPLGISWGDLNLPYELVAMVAGEEEDGETGGVREGFVPVLGWSSRPEYDSCVAGTYTLTPVLPEEWADIVPRGMVPKLRIRLVEEQESVVRYGSRERDVLLRKPSDLLAEADEDTGNALLLGESLENTYAKQLWQILRDLSYGEESERVIEFNQGDENRLTAVLGEGDLSLGYSAAAGDVDNAIDALLRQYIESEILEPAAEAFWRDFSDRSWLREDAKVQLDYAVQNGELTIRRARFTFAYFLQPRPTRAGGPFITTINGGVVYSGDSFASAAQAVQDSSHTSPEEAVIMYIGDTDVATDYPATTKPYTLIRPDEAGGVWTLNFSSDSITLRADHIFENIKLNNKNGENWLHITTPYNLTLRNVGVYGRDDTEAYNGNFCIEVTSSGAGKTLELENIMFLYRYTGWNTVAVSGEVVVNAVGSGSTRLELKTDSRLVIKAGTGVSVANLTSDNGVIVNAVQPQTSGDSRLASFFFSVNGAHSFAGNLTITDYFYDEGNTGDPYENGYGGGDEIFRIPGSSSLLNGLSISSEGVIALGDGTIRLDDSFDPLLRPIGPESVGAGYLAVKLATRGARIYRMNGAPAYDEQFEAYYHATDPALSGIDAFNNEPEAGLAGGDIRVSLRENVSTDGSAAQFLRHGGTLEGSMEGRLKNKTITLSNSGTFNLLADLSLRKITLTGSGMNAGTNNLTLLGGVDMSGIAVTANGGILQAGVTTAQDMDVGAFEPLTQSAIQSASGFGSLTVAEGAALNVTGSLTISGPVTLEKGAKLDVGGALAITGTLTLGEGAELTAASLGCEGVRLDNDASLRATNAIAVTNNTGNSVELGQNATVSGGSMTTSGNVALKSESTLTLTGGNFNAAGSVVLEDTAQIIVSGTGGYQSKSLAPGAGAAVMVGGGITVAEDITIGSGAEVSAGGNFSAASGDDSRQLTIGANATLRVGGTFHAPKTSLASGATLHLETAGASVYTFSGNGGTIQYTGTALSTTGPLGGRTPLMMVRGGDASALTFGSAGITIASTAAGGSPVFQEEAILFRTGIAVGQADISRMNLTGNDFEKLAVDREEETPNRYYILKKLVVLVEHSGTGTEKKFIRADDAVDFINSQQLSGSIVTLYGNATLSAGKGLPLYSFRLGSELTEPSAPFTLETQDSAFRLNSDATFENVTLKTGSASTWDFALGGHSLTLGNGAAFTAPGLNDISGSVGSSLVISAATLSIGGDVRDITTVSINGNMDIAGNISGVGTLTINQNTEIAGEITGVGTLNLNAEVKLRRLNARAIHSNTADGAAVFTANGSIAFGDGSYGNIIAPDTFSGSMYIDAEGFTPQIGDRFIRVAGGAEAATVFLNGLKKTVGSAYEDFTFRPDKTGGTYDYYRLTAPVDHIDVSAAGSVIYGENFTIEATLRTGSGAPITDRVGEQVTFFAGSQQLGSGTVGSDGKASFTVNASAKEKRLSAGDYVIRAEFTEPGMDAPATGQQNVTVQKRPVSITQNSDTLKDLFKDKEYDADTAAELKSGQSLDKGFVFSAPSTGTGLLSGDSLTLTGTHVFTDKNVAWLGGNVAGKAVNITVSGLGGANANDYVLSGGTATFSNVPTGAKITPRLLDVTLTAAPRVYDGTPDIAATQIVRQFISGKDVLGSDIVDVQYGNAGYSDKNAGTQKMWSANLSLSGADAANYTITAEKVYLNGVITPRDIHIDADTTGFSATKIYDGKVNLNAAGLVVAAEASEVCAGDNSGDVALKSLFFADPNVGTGKDYYATFELTGTLKGNYSIVYAPEETVAGTKCQKLGNDGEIEKCIVSISGEETVLVGNSEWHFIDLSHIYFGGAPSDGNPGTLTYTLHTGNIANFSDFFDTGSSGGGLYLDDATGKMYLRYKRKTDADANVTVVIGESSSGGIVLESANYAITGEWKYHFEATDKTEVEIVPPAGFTVEGMLDGGGNGGKLYDGRPLSGPNLSGFTFRVKETGAALSGSAVRLQYQYKDAGNTTLSSSPVNAGEYTLYISVSIDDPNYMSAYEDGKLVYPVRINKRNIELRPVDKQAFRSTAVAWDSFGDFIWDGGDGFADGEDAATIVSDGVFAPGLAQADVVFEDGSPVHTNTIGRFAVKAANAFVARNYAITNGAGYLEVRGVPLGNGWIKKEPSPNGNNGWYVDGVTGITVSSSGASPYLYAGFSDSAHTVPGSFALESVIPLGPEGERTVYLRLMDAHGIITDSEAFTFKFDKTPPVVDSVAYRQNKGEAKGVITVEARDAVSGLDTVEAICGGVTVQLSGGGANTGTFLIPVTVAGSYTIIVTDMAGNNRTNYSAEVPVDFKVVENFAVYKGTQKVEGELAPEYRESVDLTAVMTEGDPAADFDYSWNSSNPAVVRVVQKAGGHNSEVELVAVKPGQSTLTVSAFDVVKTITVYVSSIDFEVRDKNGVPVGAVDMRFTLDKELQAVLTKGDLTLGNDYLFEWKSGNNKVVTVLRTQNSGGGAVLRAVGAGQADVTVTAVVKNDPDVRVTRTLRVNATLGDISILLDNKKVTENSKVELDVGNRYELTIEPNEMGAVPGVDFPFEWDIQWQVSKPEVAAIVKGSDGKIMVDVKKPGRTDVVLTVQGERKEFTVSAVIRTPGTDKYPYVPPEKPVIVIPPGRLPGAADEYELVITVLEDDLQQTMERLIVLSRSIGIGQFRMPYWLEVTDWWQIRLVNKKTGEDVRLANATPPFAIYLPWLPEGTSHAQYDYLVVHQPAGHYVQIKDSSPFGSGIRFETLRLSPFAIIARLKSDNPIKGGDDASSGGGGGGSGSGKWDPDSSGYKDFWNEVINAINKAGDGDTVTAHCPPGMVHVPGKVPEALFGKNIDLIIRWQGNDVVINGMNLTLREWALFYYILELSGMTVPLAAATGSVTELHNPATGGDDYEVFGPGMTLVTASPSPAAPQPVSGLSGAGGGTESLSALPLPRSLNSMHRSRHADFGAMNGLSVLILIFLGAVAWAVIPRKGGRWAVAEGIAPHRDTAPFIDGREKNGEAQPQPVAPIETGMAAQAVPAPETLAGLPITGRISVSETGQGPGYKPSRLARDSADLGNERFARLTDELKRLEQRLHSGEISQLDYEKEKRRLIINL